MRACSRNSKNDERLVVRLTGNSYKENIVPRECCSLIGSVQLAVVKKALDDVQWGKIELLRYIGLLPYADVLNIGAVNNVFKTLILIKVLVFFFSNCSKSFLNV